MITFSCPTCSTAGYVPAQLSGRRVPCSECGELVLVRVETTTPLSPSPIRNPDVSLKVLYWVSGLIGTIMLVFMLSYFSRESRPTSSSPPPPPAPVPAVKASSDDLRAIRQSVERQEAAVNDERREKARKESIDKQLKELDELGRWSAEQHRRIKAQDAMLRP